MQRLQVDVLDIWYLHRVPSLEACRDFMAAGKRFVEEGLVKHIGLSEVGSAWLREAHAVHPVTVVQQEWSLLTRSLEQSLVPTCRELGVGIVAYAPLARKLLTAPAEQPDKNDRRASIPLFDDANFKTNVSLAERVKALAEERKVTGAQLSLAWLKAKAKELGVHVTPIPGSTKLHHALENFKGIDLEVSAAEMEALENLAQEVSGERTDPECMAVLIENQPAA